MANAWYGIYKHVLVGPWLRVWNRPWVEGLANIPASGPAIMASTHRSVLDSFYLPLLCPREIYFLAKSEYFTTPGLVGRIQASFFRSAGQIPVVRTSPDAAANMITSAKQVLDRGDLFGIYPEGSRAPDDRTYKGKTGMARLAMITGHPVVPIAMFNTGSANPIGTWVPRPVRVGMKVGTPIDPWAWAKERGLGLEDHATARSFTDYFMQVLVELSGRPLVDAYSSDVKKSLAAGRGYPPGCAPAPQ